MYKYSRDTYNGDSDDPTYDATRRRAKSKGDRDYTGSSSSSSNNHRRDGKENARNYKSYRSATQSQRGSISQNNKRAWHERQQQLWHNNNNLGELEELPAMRIRGLETEHDEDFYFNKVVAIEEILIMKQEPNQ
eukprot:537075_1